MPGSTHKVEFKLTAPPGMTGGGVGDLRGTLRAARQLEQTMKRLADAFERRMTGVIPQGMQRGFDRATVNIQQNIRKTVHLTQTNFVGVADKWGAAMLAESKKIGEQLAAITQRLDRGLDSALTNFERRGRRAAGRFGSALRAAGGGLRSIGGGVSGLGSGLGSAIGSLGSGGGVGGLFRSVGRLGAASAGGLGRIAGGAVGATGGVAGGLAGAAFGPGGAAIGSAIGGGITSAIGGALSGAASIGGGVLQLAGNLGGAIADKVVGTLKVGLVAGIGVAFVAASKAARAEEIEQSFASITNAAGVDAVAALERFRESARGTVSDLDLMKQFNRAAFLGAVENTDGFERLVTASRRLGKAMGVDAGKAVQDLSLGLGRQSRLILDNLGIIVRQEDATEAYAASLGKMSSELTAAERKTAFLNAAWEGIDRKLKELGPETVTFRDRLGQVKATTENLFVSLGKNLLPALERLLPFVVRIGTALVEWLNPATAGFANNLTASVSGFAGALQHVARFFEQNTFGEAIEKVGRGFDVLWNGVVAAARSAFNIIKFEARALVQDIAASIGGVIPGRGGDAENFKRAASSSREAARLEGEILVAEARKLGPQLAQIFAVENRDPPPSFGPPPDLPGGGFGGSGGGLGSAGGRGGAGVGTGAGTAPGVGSSPSGAGAPQAPPSLQRVIEALHAIGLTLEQFPPAFKDSLQDTRTAMKVIREANAVRAEEERRIALESTAAFKRVGDLGDEVERVADKRKETEKRIAELARERESIARDIFETQKRIGDIEREAARKRAAIEEQISAALQQRLEGALKSFQGQIGAEAGANLPRNLRIGVNRAQKRRDRDLERAFKAQFGGVSGSEFASNDLLRERALAFRADFRRGQQKDTDLTRLQATAVGLQNGELPTLSAELETAREEAAAQQAAAIEELTATADAAILAQEEHLASFETMADTVREHAEATAKGLQDLKEKQDSLTADLKKAKSDLEKITRVSKARKP